MLVRRVQTTGWWRRPPREIPGGLSATTAQSERPEKLSSEPAQPKKESGTRVKERSFSRAGTVWSTSCLLRARRCSDIEPIENLSREGGPVRSLESPR